MSKQVLQMKYHPAKKEVSFKRFVSDKEVVIRNDSKLMMYMNARGKFVIQDHGNGFFEDIADTFDGEKAVHMEVITTKIDYEDFLQMVEYYNESGIIKITSTLIAELPDMNETYRVVREHGERSIDILKRHRMTFFDIPLDNDKVKECVEMFATDVNKEVQSIRSKIDSMGDNLINLCFAGVYSAGKSALINAILGYQILPENINSTTARMFRIESPKAGEGVRIVFSIQDDYAELIWNEKSGYFDFGAAPNENQTRKDIQGTINDIKTEKQHRQIYEVLKELNSSPDVNADIKIHFPIPLDNERVQFVIYDTPGTDSNFGEHQTVLQDALSEQTHSILVFVAAPNKTEGEGNNALLSYLKEAEQKDSKTSIDIGRSLFVINWADSIDADSRVELQGAKIKDKDDEGFSIRLSDKKLFFTSAKVAYAAKAKQNGIQTKGEEFIIRQQSGTISDVDFGRYFQQNRCATSEYATKRMIETSTQALEKAEQAGDTLSVLLICSGLYALENEITLYGEKYAAAVRAFAIIDSVDKALSTMNKNAQSLERQNQQDIDKINNEIETLRLAIVKSIKEAYGRHEMPANEVLPRDILKTLHLDSEYLQRKINGNAQSIIENLLCGWFLGLGKVKAKEADKKAITQRITGVLSDYTREFLEKRQKLLERIRDSFIDDVKKAIRDNGDISDEAKRFILGIRPPKVSKVTNLIEFGDMYDSNIRADKFLWRETEHIDKRGYMEDADRHLTELVAELATDFEKDFRTTLLSILSAIESEFTQNTEKYSVLMQAKLADRQAMERLREKITAAAVELKSCQAELNTVIWSVIENG